MKFDRSLFSRRMAFTCLGSAATLKIERKKFADGTEKPTLVGMPVLWNVTSSDRGGYVVRLAPNSAIFAADCFCLWNHDFGQPIARTINSTLRIGAFTDQGVPIEVEPDMNTSLGRDTLANVDSGLVGGMSFSMANGFEDYTESEENGQCVLLVTRYTVDEVTITPIPAFSQTTIGVKPAEEMADENLPGTASRPGGMSQAEHARRLLASQQLRRLKLAMLKCSA